MNTYCPNCNNPIADASDQYCSACFEVRPPSGWPGQGAANAALPASPPSMNPADDDGPTSRRRERPKTVIESDIDLQAFAAQVQQQAAQSPPPTSTPQSAPPSFGSPPPVGGQPPAFGGQPPAYGRPPQQSPPPSSYGAQPSGNYGGPPPSSYGAQPPSSSYGGGGSPGYGAQPPGGGYSPPSGSGYGNAQPPSKSNTGLIIGIIVGVLLLFGACPCAGFFLFAGSASNNSPPVARSNGDDDNNNSNFDDSDNADEDDKDDDPTPRRRTRRVRRRRSGPAPVSSLNQDVITRRLTSDDWQVLGTPSQQNGPGYSTLIISIIRTPASGAVGLYHYGDTTTAISLEKNFRDNPNAAVKREGQDVVSVIMPDRPELARETLDVVLGKKSH